MNHVDSWQALTIWQSGMLWHGNWWKLPFAGRSSPIGDHVDNCLFDLCLKQLSLNTPFQHLIGIPWQMHVVPVGYPVQSIGENGNYRDNRRRLSGWTLHQTTSYVGPFTSLSSVCLWQWWQIKTNSYWKWESSSCAKLEFGCSHFSGFFNTSILSFDLEIRIWDKNK